MMKKQHFIHNLLFIELSIVVKALKVVPRIQVNNFSLLSEHGVKNLNFFQLKICQRTPVSNEKLNRLEWECLAAREVLEPGPGELYCS